MGRFTRSELEFQLYPETGRIIMGLEILDFGFVFCILHFGSAASGFGLWNWILNLRVEIELGVQICGFGFRTPKLRGINAMRTSEFTFPILFLAFPVSLIGFFPLLRLLRVELEFQLGFLIRRPTS